MFPVSKMDSMAPFRWSIPACGSRRRFSLIGSRAGPAASVLWGAGKSFIFVGLWGVLGSLPGYPHFLWISVGVITEDKA